MKNSLLGVLLFTAVASFGCAEEDTGSASGPAVGENESGASQSICPAGGSIFARTELFFGLSRSGGPDITEEEFAGFVDAEVTPRFPDGLTLVDGDGQFRGEDNVIIKEGSKLLILLHGGSKPESTKIEEIRTNYKTQFQQESVLRTDEIECVSF